jgi:hypothetical protein
MFATLSLILILVTYSTTGDGVGVTARFDSPGALQTRRELQKVTGVQSRQLM